MKTNFYLLLGIAWIAFITGIAEGEVGKLSSCEPFPWWIPILVFVYFTIPFVFGFLAGRKYD